MLLVDGHNLTFADDDAREMLLEGDADGSRRRVLHLVDTYARRVKHKATVVFDGTGGPAAPASPTPRVSFCFSGTAHSADAEILRRLRESTGRREIRVITSDRAMAAAAKKLGAVIVSLKQFLSDAADRPRRTKSPAAPEPAAKWTGPPPGEVEYWLRIFSDKDAAGPEKEQPGERPRHRKRRK